MEEIRLGNFHISTFQRKKGDIELTETQEMTENAQDQTTSLICLLAPLRI